MHIDDRVNNNNGDEAEMTMWKKAELYQLYSPLYTTYPNGKHQMFP